MQRLEGKIFVEVDEKSLQEPRTINIVMETRDCQVICPIDITKEQAKNLLSMYLLYKELQKGEINGKK